MRRFCGWVFTAVAALVFAACSANRSERLQCTDISQCEPGICLRGYCTDIDSAQVSASARPDGAEADVFVVDASGATCEARSCKQLPYGAQVTFRATEVAGFRFAGWSGSAECTGSALELVIPSLTIDTECIANYVRRLRVSGLVEGAQGGDGVAASAGDPFARCSGNSCEVDANSVVELTARERVGERFLGWSGAGCESSGSWSATVRVRDQDVACSASFRPRVAIGGRAMNVDVAVGVATDDPTRVCESGSCVVDAGSTVTLTAPVVSGFRFSGWSGSSACTGSSSPLALRGVSAPQLCLATYTARVQVRGSAEGALPAPPVVAESSDAHSVCSGAECEIDRGGAVTLLAGSAPGYRLTHWSGPICEGETGAVVSLGAIEGDLACVAQYLPGIAVIGSVVGAPGAVVASSSSPGAICAAGSCSLAAGSSATLSAPALPGYRFEGWMGDSGCTGSELAISFDSVLESRTCYARYQARYVVRGVASPSEGGRVVATSGSPGALCADASCTLDKDGTAQLEAIPSESFRFSGWSGGASCSGAEPRLTIAAVGGNISCQANFNGRVSVAGVVGAGMGSVVARSTSAGSSCDGASCSLDLGSSAVLVATAAPGFQFAGWSGCADSQAADLALSDVRANATCTAAFAPLRFTIASSVVPAAGGTVVASSPAASASCQAGSCAVDAGSSVTLTATGNPGYRFTGWGGCQTGGEPAITLASVTSNASCEANFTRLLLTASATVAPATGGSVSASASSPGASCSGLTCTVPSGGAVTFTASAATGFRFVNWSGCSASTEPLLTLADLAASASCQANFERTRYTVAGVANPPGAGTITASSPALTAECTGAQCSLFHGSPARLTAAAAAGYRFVSWSCPGANGASVLVGNVGADVSCEARFQPLSYAVSASASAGGSVSAATESGTCTGASCQITHGGSVSFVAAAAAGFSFSGWASSCTADPGNPLLVTLSSVAGPRACRATFAPASYTVSASAGDGGSVSASTSSGSCSGASCQVPHGGSVRFTAIPGAGYSFAGWSAGCTAELANPLRVTLTAISAPASCSASFRQLTYAVIGLASAGGTVTGETLSGSCMGGTCQVAHGGSATLSAYALAGFRFGGWSSGCVADSAEPLRVSFTNVTQGRSCSASFSRISHQVSATAGAGGSVSATTATGSCQGGSCQIHEGGSVTFVARPAAGHTFAGWSCPGAIDGTLTLAAISAPASCVASFTPLSFAVVGSAGPGGTVTGSTSSGSCTGGSCQVSFGGSAVLTASADPGFGFSGWAAGCTADAENPLRVTLINVAAPRSCSASFTRLRHAVTASAGAGGTVRGTTNSGSCTGGSCQILHGGSVTFTAIAADGFSFAGWSCMGAVGAILTLAPVTAPASCAASFTRNTFPVTATSGVGGSVAGMASNGSCVGAVCQVAQGGSATFIATAMPGFAFESWGCPGAQGATWSVTNVTAAASCAASFVPLSYRVAATAIGGGTLGATTTSGSCNGAVCQITHGGSVTFAAQAPAGVAFVGWGGSCSASPQAPLQATLTNVTSTASCTATFRAATFTIRGSALGGGTISGSSAGAACPAGVCTVASGGSVTFSAGPDTATARFEGWSGDCVGRGNSRMAAINNVTADGTCVANFAAVERIWIAVPASSTGGSASVSAQGGNAVCTGGLRCDVNRGTSVTLTATPARGFAFVNWLGCPVASQTATTTILANANDTCFPQFQPTIPVPR